MKNKREHIDEVLMLRIIENSANEMEQLRFNEWINRSSENREFYSQFEELYHLSSSFDHAQSKANWKDVMNKIGNNVQVPDYIELPELANRQATFGKNMIIRIAAAILLIVGVSFLLKTVVFKPEQLRITGNNLENNEAYHLADGSLVYLNGESEITFSKKFGTKSREVFLDGEGFFEVKKNEELPFIIKTNNTSIKVVGTSFNIHSDLTGTVKVSVVSGVVIFSKDPQNTVKLTKGEEGIFNPLTDKMEKNVISDPNFLSWKSGIYIFKDTPISEAFELLGQHYSKVFLYKGVNEGALKITTVFDNQPLDSVLEELNLLLNTEIELNHDTIVFKPNS